MLHLSRLLRCKLDLHLWPFQQTANEDTSSGERGTSRLREEADLQGTSQPLPGPQRLLSWMEQLLGKPAWAGAPLSLG